MDLTISPLAHMLKMGVRLISRSVLTRKLRNLENLKEISKSIAQRNSPLNILYDAVPYIYLLITFGPGFDY
jgi:DNA-binding HxlR family transcriptional regulator